MTEITVKNSQENIDCSPMNSVYCTLKMKITGNLNEKNLNNLYNCTLCNQCKTASFNRSTREKAVCNNLITPHVAEIRENINKFGNSYGLSSPSKEKKQKNMEIILFRGCTPRYKTPEILESVKCLLKQKGIKYGIINDEECCGSILFNLGDNESGVEVVKKNIEKFKKLGVKKIITICPGCYNAFNKYYKEHGEFDTEIILAIDLFNESIVNAEDFTIQDPCHARDKANNVRKIIKGTKNKSTSPCCGAGSGLMAHNTNMAINKAKMVLDKNIKKIITYCPFCYINLSSVKSDNVIDVYMFLDEKYNYNR